MTRAHVSLCPLVLLFAACAAPHRPGAEPETVDARFPYRVPFEIGHTENADGSVVTIEEVWGTRPTFEVGGSYIATGIYRLADADKGEIVFFQTANNWNNSGPVIDSQRAKLTSKRGRFELRHEMRGPGWFHLILRADEGKTHRNVVDMYFGHGDTLLEHKSW